MTNKYQEAIDFLTKIQIELLKQYVNKPVSTEWLENLKGFRVAIDSLVEGGRDK